MLLCEPPLAAIQHSANRLGAAAAALASMPCMWFKCCLPSHVSQLHRVKPPRLAFMTADAWVCSRCFRFIGSLEQQLARYISAVRCGAAEGAASGSGSECGDDGGSEAGSHVAAALALDDGAVEALASGQLSLPHASAFPLPAPARCRGGCREEWYCGEACAEAAWQQWHQLLCLGPDGSQTDSPGSSDGRSGADGKGKAPAVASQCSLDLGGAAGKQSEGRRAALADFLRLADDTNDVIRLAAVVVAQVLLAAEQQLPEPGPGSGGAASSSDSEPSVEACWHALLAGWQPFASGHKALWWEVGSLPPEAADDMRHLAADALQLLVAALPPRLSARYPALLQLPVWGSIIGAPARCCTAGLPWDCRPCGAASAAAPSTFWARHRPPLQSLRLLLSVPLGARRHCLTAGMFELNNLDVIVGSPLQPWLELLEDLPEEEREAAHSAAGERRLQCCMRAAAAPRDCGGQV